MNEYSFIQCTNTEIQISNIFSSDGTVQKHTQKTITVFKHIKRKKNTNNTS